MNLKSKNLQAYQLFKFIREFVRLSQKPVESLDAYIKTFWLDQIPHEPECSFVAWTEPDKMEGETVIESRLAVERPERPEPPPVSACLMPWVNIARWHNSAIDVPELSTESLTYLGKEMIPCAP